MNSKLKVLLGILGFICFAIGACQGLVLSGELGDPDPFAQHLFGGKVGGLMPVFFGGLAGLVWMVAFGDD